MRPLLGLARPMMAQRLDRERRQIDTAPAAIGFGFLKGKPAGVGLLERARDRRGRGVEIDLGPAQRQQLATFGMHPTANNTGI